MPVCWFPQPRPRFAGWQLLMSLAVSCYSHSGSYFLAHPWYCILSYRILWVFFFPIYLIYTIRYTLPVATHAFQWGKENIQVCRHPPLASLPGYGLQHALLIKPLIGSAVVTVILAHWPMGFYSIDAAVEDSPLYFHFHTRLSSTLPPDAKKHQTKAEEDQQQQHRTATTHSTDIISYTALTTFTNGHNSNNNNLDTAATPTHNGHDVSLLTAPAFLHSALTPSLITYTKWIQLPTPFPVRQPR